MSRALPSIGVVVLSMGNRPVDLTIAVDSALAQEGVELDVLVVGNGWEPTGLPDGARALALPENLGIPEGRNVGAAHVTGELVFFLDDDAVIPSTTALRTMAERFARRPKLGMAQALLTATDGSESPGRWVRRLRKGDPRRSSPIFSVTEGVTAVRRDAFEGAGGWAGAFFYAHEGIELAWRVWDQGFEVWHMGDVEMHHPATDPSRHAVSQRLNGRNRVWLARRNLPVVLRPLYLGTWTAVQVLRDRSDRAALRVWFTGFREGFAEDPGDVRVMSWRTVARMTAHGRPPIV
ncbi:glycosyltransferase family 2 protein [Cellulomonas sp. PhB150]|uniref:glycosyltransferase family 2 protein n=1 Tax=Cellulomonas sp. PhB150 TaxID=2485188 RepID=UPI000F488E4B|nr:glycosyltransferase [Cellulomonas sp. PhB150]ROS31219.1 GT2 family glycosyltransferase [Cellulomonas sp. PhB150]